MFATTATPRDTPGPGEDLWWVRPSKIRCTRCASTLVAGLTCVTSIVCIRICISPDGGDQVARKIFWRALSFEILTAMLSVDKPTSRHSITARSRRFRWRRQCDKLCVRPAATSEEFVSAGCTPLAKGSKSATRIPSKANLKKMDARGMCGVNLHDNNGMSRKYKYKYKYKTTHIIRCSRVGARL
jgi:hypothetical protein